MGCLKPHWIFCLKLNNTYNDVGGSGWRYTSLFIVHLLVWSFILNGINTTEPPPCEAKVLEELPPDPVSI